ncbi:MAG: hypothetical protein ACFFD4_18790 [Candidatus Odinarchaeota archaeon]
MTRGFQPRLPSLGAELHPEHGNVQRSLVGLLLGWTVSLPRSRKQQSLAGSHPPVAAGTGTGYSIGDYSLFILSVKGEKRQKNY